MPEATVIMKYITQLSQRCRIYRREECVGRMALRGKSSDVALRGVPTESLGVEYVPPMALRGNVVASRIATTMPRKEESVSHMAQRLNDAALRDVPIKS